MDYYDYSTSTYTTTSSDVGVVAIVIWLFVVLIVLAVSILMIIAMWRIFTKAGKPGWTSLVPIYNMVVMMQIVGRPEWQVVLMFLPFAHIYISIVLPLDLAKSFGKTTGFGVLMIFFPAIMNPILAFGSSRYVGPVMRQQPVYGQPPQPGYYAPQPAYGQPQQPVAYTQQPQPYAQPQQPVATVAQPQPPVAEGGQPQPPQQPPQA